MNYNIIILIVFSSFFCSCKNKKDDKCEELYSHALDCWFQYVQTDDTLALYQSNQYIDSIDCKPVKKKVFELKLALMFTMKKFDDGKRYINSFEISDFGMPYKKNMYLKAFDAAILESQGDTIHQKQIYKELIQEIQGYLNINANEETLQDLFMIKAKIENKADIIKELENIHSSKIYKDDFIELLMKAIEIDT